MKPFIIKDLLDRLKKHLQISSDMELSAILGVKPNTISTWRKRNSINYEYLICVCRDHKIDLNELFLERQHMDPHKKYYITLDLDKFKTQEIYKYDFRESEV